MLNPDGPAPPAGLRYPAGHWLRQADPARVLAAYAGQQAKAYSRVKNRFLAELLDDLAGRSFLDFGCGPGWFVAHAVQAGVRRVVGVDREPAALAAARRLAGGRPELVCARDLAALAPEAGFDVILATDVLEHLPDDLGFLRAAARRLNPGGRLVLATQNAWSLNWLLEGLVRRLAGERAWRGWDPTHLRFYTPAGLAALLTRAGLAPLAWRSSYLVPHKLPRGGGRYLRLEFLTALDRRLGGRRPLDRLGWCLMVAARPAP